MFRCYALKCGGVGIFSGELSDVCGFYWGLRFVSSQKIEHRIMDLQFFMKEIVVGQDYTTTLVFLVSFLYIASEYMN